MPMELVTPLRSVRSPCAPRSASRLRLLKVFSLKVFVIEIGWMQRASGTLRWIRNAGASKRRDCFSGRKSIPRANSAASRYGATGGACSWTEEGTDAITNWKRFGKKAGEFGAFSSFGTSWGDAVCSQLPDAIMVAAHSWCGPVLCSFSCNCGELAMVNAVKKAMTMLMPMPARAFMPAGDLVDARHCASVFRTPVARTIHSYS